MRSARCAFVRPAPALPSFRLFKYPRAIVDIETSFGSGTLDAAGFAATVGATGGSSEQATDELIKAVPELLAANKCPDFIEDKGHYFGSDLSDNDKRALIEYLKTF